MFGNVAGIVAPIVIGYLVAKTGWFDSALAFVGANAAVTVFSYLVTVKEIKRVELGAVFAPTPGIIHALAAPPAQHNSIGQRDPQRNRQSASQRANHIDVSPSLLLCVHARFSASSWRPPDARVAAMFACKALPSTRRARPRPPRR